MAIGNPLGMGSSVTTGVVSAVNREVSDGENNSYLAIQTNAAINSGNSGGALVNSLGQVIGINTLKIAGNGVEGMGFAIPISSTVDVVNQLIEFKSVKRPYIGLSGSAVSDAESKKYNLPKGVLVDTIEEGSPAEKAGLQASDIITKIEGNSIKNVTELNRIKNKYKIGDTVSLTIIRNGEELEVKVTLAEMPETDTEPENTQNLPNSKDNKTIFDLFR